MLIVLSCSFRVLTRLRCMRLLRKYTAQLWSVTHRKRGQVKTRLSKNSCLFTIIRILLREGYELKCDQIVSSILQLSKLPIGMTRLPEYFVDRGNSKGHHHRPLTMTLDASLSDGNKSSFPTSLLLSRSRIDHIRGESFSCHLSKTAMVFVMCWGPGT